MKSETNTEIQTVECAQLNPRPLGEYQRWGVAFRAFNRTCDTLSEAIAYCNRCDLDPEEIYPVAIGYMAPVEGARWLQRDPGPHSVMRVDYYIFDK